MAATGDGVNDYIQADSTISPPTNYSYAFWYNPDHSPNTTDTRQPFSMFNTTGAVGTYDCTFVWDYPDSAIYKGATHRESGGSYKRCQISSTPGSGEYVHIAVTYDGTDIKVYYNGVLEATTAASAPANSDNPTIHICAYSSTIGFDDASVSNVCVWNTGLTAAQVASLATGVVPNTIASGSVVFYHRLDTGDSTTTGPTVTNNGATINVSHIVGSSGGLTIGGTESITTEYTVTNSGGLVIGGTFDKTFGKSLATTVSISDVPVDAPHIRTSVFLANSFAPTSFRESIDTPVSIRSVFSPVIPGVLVSGRTLGNDRL